MDEMLGKEAFHNSLSRGEFHSKKIDTRKNSMGPLYEWEEKP